MEDFDLRKYLKENKLTEASEDDYSEHDSIMRSIEGEHSGGDEFELILGLYFDGINYSVGTSKEDAENGDHWENITDAIDDLNDAAKGLLNNSPREQDPKEPGSFDTSHIDLD